MTTTPASQGPGPAGAAGCAAPSGATDTPAEGVPATALARTLDLAIAVGVVALAVLLYIVAFWGVPLDSDTKPTYLIQVETSPTLKAVTPYGLWAAMAYPMGPVEACLQAYRAYGRYNCGETTMMRTIARVAGDNADAWRLVYVAFNGAWVAVFVLIARRLGVPRPLVLVLALSLILGPLDLWTDAKSAEPKATLFLLLAIWLALRASSWKGQALSAAMMLLAALTKEPYAASWVAVLGVALARHVERTELPLVAGPRSAWRPLVTSLLSAWRPLLPHAVAMAAVVGYAAFLAATVPREANIILPSDLPYPPVDRAIAQYAWWAQPWLLRGSLPFALLVGGVALVVLVRREPGTAAELRRRYARWPFLLLLAGLVGAAVLHGLVYFLAGRLIADERYLVPGNALTALAIGMAVLPLLQALSPASRRTLGLTVLLAAVLAHLWRTWFSRGIRTGLLDELTLVGLGIAALVALAAFLVVRLARRPSPTLTAVVAASVVLLLTPHVDRALDYAGTWRVFEEGWQAYLDDVLEQAPPNGHVLLRVAGPNMIEHVWATEVYTLRHGRLDLTYHLDVGTPPYEDGPSDLVHDYFVAAYNRGRTPLPADGRNVLVVRASRTGVQRNVVRRLFGPPAVALLLESPSRFFRNRYVEGKVTFWRYELSHGIVP